MSTKSAFRNQRAVFHNYSPPYGEKTLDHPRWLFPSRKNNRQILCWTQGEFNTAVALEAACPTLVHSYEERPQLIMLRDGLDWHRYTPSFQVGLASGVVMLELSHLGQPQTPIQMVVSKLADLYFARSGIRFVHLSSAKLYSQARAGSAALLLRHLSSVPTAAEVMQARDLLANGPVPIARLEAALNVRRGRLLAMVRRGELQLIGPPPYNLQTLVARAGYGPAL